MWPSIFALTNIIALVAWAILLFLPRRPLAKSAVLFLGVGLLCFVYTLLLGLLLAKAVDPGALPGAQPFDPADYSIEGLRRLFMSDAGIVVGWTHYLAFDLFTGLWIAGDADRKGWSRLVQAPILLLTFLAGPAGLLVWLILRERGARREARAAR